MISMFDVRRSARERFKVMVMAKGKSRACGIRSVLPRAQLATKRTIVLTRVRVFLAMLACNKLVRTYGLCC